MNCKTKKRPELKALGRLKCKTIWFLFLSSFQGVKFKILSYQTLPWITVMKKISDSEDAYEFSGPVPDVWFALQVKKNSI